MIGKFVKGAEIATIPENDQCTPVAQIAMVSKIVKIDETRLSGLSGMPKT